MPVVRMVATRGLPFDNVRDGEGKVRVHVWDYICVAGENVKEGEATSFDADSLEQMISNFIARGDQVPIDFNHQSNFTHENGQPAPGLGFYGALASVFDGKVMKMGYARGVDPVAIGPPLDKPGLWGYRCEVTELGQQLLPNYKYLSPTFTPDGVDQLSNPIGYQLLAVAATNTPWQAGTELTFECGARPRGVTTMAKLSKLARFVRMEESADDKTIKQAIMEDVDDQAAKAMEGDETYNYDDAATRLEEMAQHYEDAKMEEDDGAEAPHVTMRKMAAKFRKLGAPPADAGGTMGDPPFGGKETPSEEAAEGHKMEEEAAKESMQAFARRLGVPLPASASAKQMMAAIQAAAVPASQIPSIVQAQVKAALADEQRKRVAQETADKARVLVRAAIDGGYPRENEQALMTFASDPKNFAAAEAMAKPFLRGAETSLLFSRMTAGGSPHGVDGRQATVGGPDQRIVAMSALGNGARAVVYGEKLSSAVNDLADSDEPRMRAKVDRELPEGVKGTRYESYERYMAAERIIARERPDLVRAASEDA
jgi:Mu-like prophage I protein